MGVRGINGLVRKPPKTVTWKSCNGVEKMDAHGMKIHLREQLYTVTPMLPNGVENTIVQCGRTDKKVCGEDWLRNKSTSLDDLITMML